MFLYKTPQNPTTISLVIFEKAQFENFIFYIFERFYFSNTIGRKLLNRFKKCKKHLKEDMFLYEIP